MRHWILVMAGLVGAVSCATDIHARGADAATTGSVEIVAALTEALVSPVGEYEALAFYAAVLEKHGDALPFRNVVHAERRHADALVAHLERYGAQVPTNPWTGRTTAPATLLEAAQTCVDGETSNVEMYDRLIKAAASDPAVVQTLEQLRFASKEHHLPAFQRAVARGGTMGRGPGGGGPGGPGRRGAGAQGAAGQGGVRHGKK